jgi:hypothetical protein
VATGSLRLRQETQGTVAEEGHRRIVKLPEGSEIAFVRSVAEHPEMVEVSWQGQSVWIFAVDFEARTKEDARPLTKAMSVGSNGPEPGTETDIKAHAPTGARTPVNTEQKTAGAPTVRRFNSSGRELF